MEKQNESTYDHMNALSIHKVFYILQWKIGGQNYWPCLPCQTNPRLFEYSYPVAKIEFYRYQVESF